MFLFSSHPRRIGKKRRAMTARSPTTTAAAARSKSFDLEDPSPSSPTKPRRFSRQPSRLALALLCVLTVVLTLLRSVPRESSPQLKQTRQIRTRPFNKSVAYDHLIVVAGHAVTMAESLEKVAEEDAAWYLLEYQRRRDLPGEFVAHVKRGVEIAAKDPRSLLLFSGGQTRGDAGPRSEAQSYFFVAEHFDWFDRPEVASRAGTEEFARDSFENLLFSICRFQELTTRYPLRQITVVSFDFKRFRFEALHAPALRYPSTHFRYEPMNPFTTNPQSRFDLQAAAKGEATTVAPFKADPYGCSKDVLLEKRRARDPFNRSPPYGPNCPHMRDLLHYCGPNLFNASLPWYHHHPTTTTTTTT